MSLAGSLGRARARSTRLPWLTLILALVVTAAVVLSPFYLVLRALEYEGSHWDLLTSSSAMKATWRTIVLSAAVTASCTAIAVPAAWLTVRTDLPFRGMWTVLLALPLAVPSFIGSFVVVSALSPGGMLQDLLEPFGVERLPSLYGFKGTWLTLTFFSYPYVYLTVRAALKRADPSIEEAARSLNQSAMATFWRVNLPQLRPAISAGAILISLYVVSEFGAVSMLRYDTLTPLIYIQYTTSFDRSSAAVLGLPLLAIAATFIAMDAFTRGRARYHTQGPRRAQRTLRLGRWRWPAAGFCAFVTAAGVGLPMSVLSYWLIKGMSQGESARFAADALFNSVRVSGAAAIVTVLGALPIAFLVVRHPGRFTNRLEQLAYSGQGLPGVTIALSLVFFAANYTPSVYRTFWLLVFAYAIRFLPEALGACRSALLQVNPHTEEAARSLGAGSLRVFLTVTAPQMAPGMLAGGLLSFLTATKELQITLLLSPIGFDTLTTQVWSATSQAFFTRAALPAMLLVALSAVAVLLILRRDRMEQ